MIPSRPLFDPLIENSKLNSRRLAKLGELTSAEYPREAIVDMSTNENAYGTAPEVVTAVVDTAQTLNRYPTRTGELKLRQQIATFHHPQLSADNIVLGNAGSEILQHLADGFLQPGDEVISFTPTFSFYPNAAQRCGATMVWLDLLPEQDFAMSTQRILDAVTDQTRAVYLCNPNNPTGNIITSAEIDSLMAALPEDILVVSDEVYYQFVDDPSFPNTLPYILNGRNLVQVFSFSKAYGLAGLRLGYGIARPEIAAYMAKLQRTFMVDKLSVAAGSAAIAAQDHIKRTVDGIIRGRNWLTNQLQELDIQVWPGQGNFLLLDLGVPASPICQRLLNNHGIAVADGDRRFGLPTCIRVTVGQSAENQRFIEALSTELSA